MPKTLSASAVVLLLVGCAAPEPREPLEPTAVPFGVAVQRRSLDRVFDPSFSFTGVAIDPTSRATLVLDPKRGIYDAATGAQVFSFATREIAAATVDREASFDDFAILDSARLVLIAKNDGYVFDRVTQRLLNRFCYLPGPVQQQDPDAYQVSHSVGWDPAAGKIYAQPQTFSTSNQIVRAELGVFSPESATPLEWQPFTNQNFNAGGMAVESRASIWLGESRFIHHYDANTGRFLKSVDVATMDLQRIEGLALDTEHQALIVLDGERRELVDVPLSAVR